MKRRSFLQGLLALPFIGLATKALASHQTEALKNIPKTGVVYVPPGAGKTKPFREVSHVIFFNRETIKSKGWTDIVPVMVFKDRESVPPLVMEHADCVGNVRAWQKPVD